MTRYSVLDHESYYQPQKIWRDIKKYLVIFRTTGDFKFSNKEGQVTDYISIQPIKTSKQFLFERYKNRNKSCIADRTDCNHIVCGKEWKKWMAE